MKIIIGKNGIKTSELIKLVGVGYVFGAGILFIIPILLGLLVALVSGNTSEMLEIGVALLLIPIILAMQAVMFSLIIALGHKIFKKFKPLEIEQEK